MLARQIVTFFVCKKCCSGGRTSFGESQGNFGYLIIVTQRKVRPRYRNNFTVYMYYLHSWLKAFVKIKQTKGEL